MSRALGLAIEAGTDGDVPVGAVVVDASGEIVGEGRNLREVTHDPTAHAEIVVMREAARRLGNHRLAGSTLYVTVEPCIMCVGAIVQARLRRLVYAAADRRYGAVESMVRAFDLGVNHRPEVASGLMAEEASSLMKDFFRQRR